MLTDGEEFVVTPLDMEPGTFRSLTIREIATLTYSGGKWLLGGKPLEKAWFPEVRRRVTELGRTNVFTLFNLCRLVGESYPGPSEQNPERLAELQNRVCAVAWTRERFDDYPGPSAEASKHETTDVTEPLCIPAA